ncbi:hypothetical protein TSH100_16375 [Azospirillum sp. TSH100]|nr:hypothetical protein TSH100_16375 [Azospirillum sp. TSH100]
MVADRAGEREGAEGFDMPVSIRAVMHPAVAAISHESIAEAERMGGSLYSRNPSPILLLG